MEIGLNDSANPDPSPANLDPSPANLGHLTGNAEPDASGPVAVLVRDEPAGTIVAVQGELDLLSAPRLRTALDAPLRANARHIAIDLTRTTFMDSAGIHAILDAHHRANGHLAVICAAGPVRQVIELLGLVQMLNVVSTLDEYRASRAGA